MFAFYLLIVLVSCACATRQHAQHQLHLDLGASWECPSTIANAEHEDFCKRLTVLNPPVECKECAIDNCFQACNRVLWAAGVPEELDPPLELEVDVLDPQSVRCGFAQQWTRVLTGAGHEYVVERNSVGNQYRIYQAKSDGPRGFIDLKAWLSNNATFEGVGDTMITSLSNVRGTPRWNLMFNPLPNTTELSSWWNALIKEDKQSHMASEMTGKIQETWNMFGQGKWLKSDDFMLFLARPMQAGGGSAPRDATGETLSVTIKPHGSHPSCDMAPSWSPTTVAPAAPADPDKLKHSGCSHVWYSFWSLALVVASTL